MSVPFWWNYSLGPSTILYAFVLAVVAALIMGVLPGLKATGQRLSANLQELHGRTGTRLGSMWTTLIVAQVAVAVAILPAAVFLDVVRAADGVRRPQRRRGSARRGQHGPQRRGRGA